MTRVGERRSATSAAGAGPARDDERARGYPSRRTLVRRRFLRSKRGVAGLTVILALFALAYLSPLCYPWGYAEEDYSAFLAPPSLRHWFGTTQIGRDVFILTMRGLQKSLIIGLLVGAISTGLATVVGTAAGYFGRWTDRTAMWIVDLLLVLPAFLLVAILSPLFSGRTWLILVLLLAAFSWMIMARLVRGMTLSLREREFVQAARFMGVAPARIIVRHIVPNLASLLIIDATITVGVAILAETSLSYLGFGVAPPDVSLGTLIADGTDSLRTFPWLFLFGSAALILAVLSVNLVGDALRDAIDSPAGDGGRSRAGAAS